jgi:transcriptional regulator of heat shock response
MIANRYRLTPQQKLSAKAHELQCISDSQYLIANRLRELTVLLKEKRTQFENTQLRIQTKGSSTILERELVQQREQIEDLLQLGEDWRNLLELCSEKPDLTELSAPLKVMLRSLGIQATA